VAARAEVDDYQRAWVDVGLRVGVYVPLSMAGMPYGLLAAGTTSEMSGPEMGRRLPALLEFATVANAMLGPQLQAQSGELQINALREMIASGGLRTVFQPVVRLKDRHVIGYEALTRFTDGSSPVQRFAEAEAPAWQSTWSGRRWHRPWPRPDGSRTDRG
jgi:hypothetical protein